MSALLNQSLGTIPKSSVLARS
jgi:hypothetical protein